MNCTLCSFTPDFHANHAEQLRALKALLEDIHDQAKILLHLHRRVREFANNTFNLTSMVSDLTLRKLQTVRGANDHDLVAGADGLSLPELLERRQGDTTLVLLWRRSRSSGRPRPSASATRSWPLAQRAD